jgi:predicted Zn finger-like uncharacterized protein
VKIEIRCSGCGRGYLIDEARIPAAGGVVACKACGGRIELPKRDAPAAGPPPRSIAPPAPPSPTARPVRAGAEDPAAAAGQVVCPRCALHFVPGKTVSAAPTAGRATVLVVEDMDYFREIATDALSSKYDVKTATSLEEARRALAAGGIHLILLDLTLDGGEEGLSLLRDMPFKPCPVIIYTAEDETEMYGESWDRLRALGVDDLVIKGINVGESLARKVAVLLGEPEPEPPAGR